VGFLTLGQIKLHVKNALGGRVQSTDPRLSEWVNLGYMEVIGAIDFPELEKVRSIQTSSGRIDYAILENDVEVKIVYDQLAKYGLRFVKSVEFFRQDLTMTGSPKMWTRVGNSVFITPSPSDSRSVLIVTEIDVGPLVDDEDKTKIHNTWDAAVMMFAVRFALLSLNEDARSALWYNNALNYVQSRKIGSLTRQAQPSGGA